MPNVVRPAQIRALLRLSRAIDGFTERLGGLVTGLVVITIAVGFYNVVARYVGRLVGLKLSSNALIELQWYLFSLLFLFGFAYILKRGSNVRVDFLYAHLKSKWRSLIDLLGTLLFLIPFCLIGIYVTINPVLMSWGRSLDGTWGPWELSSDADGLPRAPIKTMIIVGFVLLLVQALSQVIKYFAVVMGYQEAEALIQTESPDQLPIE